MRAEDIKEFLGDVYDWRPDAGVVSVYVGIDRGDRGDGWRLALREQLRDQAIEPSIAERVLRRFPENGEPPAGRSHIGFFAVGEDREVWHSLQSNGISTAVHHEPAAHLTPLIRLLADQWWVGVAVVGLENVRVIEYGLGEARELAGWELEITSLDWRERKSNVRAPAGDGTGTTASGRDQYRQRLDHNRERFLKQAGELVRGRYGDRPWRQVVVIGEGDRPKLFVHGLGATDYPVHEIHQDLIGVATAAVGERVEEELEFLNRTREDTLIRRLEEAVGAHPGAALGPEAVVAALGQGQAQHVIFDCEGDWAGEDADALREQLVEQALATGAQITPVGEMAAATLRSRGGVAALLRYATPEPSESAP